MLKILWRSFKVIKGSLWRHFRLDTKCSNWVEIWYEWSLSQSSHAKNFSGSFKVIKGLLWRHFRFDIKCSNWAEIWYEWSLSQSKHVKILKTSFNVIEGSLWGHFGFIQNAHIELKFDMNDPEVNLNMLKWFQISFNVINGSWGYFRSDNTFHLSSEIEILENYYRQRRNEHQMNTLYHSGFKTHSDLPPQSKWWSILNSPVYQCLLADTNDL